MAARGARRLDRRLLPGLSASSALEHAVCACPSFPGWISVEELVDACWMRDPCFLEKGRHGQEPGAERLFADPVDGEEVEVWAS
ncbi:hypothetical protein GW17_00019632 [Ensete ventricosum]|nr:hypothetical protein GW17_00019632 [Ensete ventricosum]